MTPEQDLQLTRFREFNSLRVADWRWQRAVLLNDTNSKRATKEDPTVNVIRKYLKDSVTFDTSSEVAEKYPELYEIDFIFKERGTVRWSIEALVISDTPAVDIAAHFGFPTHKLVELYEATKFDVRSRLSAPGFIEQHLFSHVGQAPSDENILKLLGWIGYNEKIGPILIHDWVNCGLIRENVEVESWYHDIMRRVQQRKTLRGVLRQDPTFNELLPHAVSNYMQFKKLDSDLAKSLPDGINTEDDYATLLKSINLTVASIEHKPTNGIEPRAYELIEQQIGESLGSQTDGEKSK